MCRGGSSRGQEPSTSDERSSTDSVLVNQRSSRGGFGGLDPRWWEPWLSLLCPAALTGRDQDTVLRDLLTSHTCPMAQGEGLTVASAWA